MADEPQEQQAEGGGKGKLIIGIVLALVVVGGAYMFLFSGGGEEAVADASVEPVEGLVVDGATMTVALNEDAPAFARVSFALVLAEGVDTVEVGKKIQILQDSALSLIIGYSSAELKTAVGLDRLRSDLTNSAHAIWDPNEVLRVVLTEVIVQ